MIAECPRHADSVSTLGGVQAARRTASARVDCSNLAYHFRYRSSDGTCNNFESPDWAAAHTPLLRLMPAEYEDGQGTPIGTVL